MNNFYGCLQTLLQVYFHVHPKIKMVINYIPQNIIPDLKKKTTHTFEVD